MQKEFLETDLGQTINGVVDIGISSLFPNYISEDIIEVKDAIITDGFKCGIQTAISNVIDCGKNIQSVFTGKFDNVSQIREVLEKGGLIDSISEILDSAINLAKNNKIIKSKTATAIRKEKNTILKNIKNSVDNNLEEQAETIEKINKYIENWKENFTNEDFNSMEKEYKKINKALEGILPIKNTLEKVEKLQTMHELIKNNGQNFNLSNEEIELIKLFS